MKNKYIRTFTALLFFQLVIYSIIYLFFDVYYYINENQVLYIFSTFAQVIASVYGLTMAGYVFLNDSLNKMKREDDSLDEIITIIKKNYYQDIIMISIIGILSILLCKINLGIYYKEWLLNITIIFCSTALVMIFSFVVIILNPSKIEKVSAKLKQEEEDEGYEEGDLKQFLTDFNEIEDAIRNYIGDSAEVSEKKDTKYRFSNRMLANILYKNEKIDETEYRELIQLISYRNYVVHSSEVNVDKKMCEKMAALKSKIIKKLKN